MVVLFPVEESRILLSMPTLVLKGADVGNEVSRVGVVTISDSLVFYLGLQFE